MSPPTSLGVDITFILREILRVMAGSPQTPEFDRPPTSGGHPKCRLTAPQLGISPYLILNSQEPSAEELSAQPFRFSSAVVEARS